MEKTTKASSNSKLAGTVRKVDNVCRDIFTLLISHSHSSSNDSEHEIFGYIGAIDVYLQLSETRIQAQLSLN